MVNEKIARLRSSACVVAALIAMLHATPAMAGGYPGSPAMGGMFPGFPGGPGSPGSSGAPGSSGSASGNDDWPMSGKNAANTNAAEGRSLADVSRLAPKWTFTTGGDVSARAAVVGGKVYFPDWGGNLWAVDAAKGTKIWGHQLSEYGLTGSQDGVYHSRTSPAVDDGVVYVGTQEGAWLLAIDATTGKLLWKTQIETDDLAAVITASPAVVDDVLYTGVSSNQEALAGVIPGYVCCTARGSVVAVNLTGRNRGKIAWKTYMVPVGYNGAAVWGSNPVVDTERSSVYIGTGNNYSLPIATAPSSVYGKTYGQCIAAAGTPATCTSPDNHVDSLLALNLKTGAVKWARKMVTWSQPQQGVADGSDTWNVACFTPNAANCPAGKGPDYDFGSAPNLITFKTAQGRKKTILGAGQKSGIYYAIDPDTGADIWRRQVGPGSTLGGIEWGSASDGKRIYVSVTNFFGIPTASGSAGSWSALDPETGNILWQVGDPNGSIGLGPLTVAGDVVYAPSMAGGTTAPTMLALSAATGQMIWSYAAGSSVNAGAVVVKGDVYWGSGYSHLGIPGFTGNSKFFAFSVKDTSVPPVSVPPTSGPPHWGSGHWGAPGFHH